MARITFKGKLYACRENETVLQAFQRYGVTTPFSCRNGVCYTCMLKNVNGDPPAIAQAGLRPGLRKLGYFLPCTCIPETEMEIEPPCDADLFLPVTVLKKTKLSPQICKLLLKPVATFYFHPGQFIHLRRPDGLTRNFSLAGLSRQDGVLEIHVKRIAEGAMSSWIFDVLQEGDRLQIEGPQGHCCYVKGRWDAPVLLIGTGSGLGPLLGIVQEALAQGHTGDIFLYHGSRREAGLYARDLMKKLSQAHPNFHAVSCVSGPKVPDGCAAGRADEVAFARHADLRQSLVYLCGHPEMVQAAKKEALQRGAKEDNLHADPFIHAHETPKPIHPEGTPIQEREEASTYEEPEDPAPDPEIWHALGEGRLLHEILTDFYTQVYDDPQLSPFFAGVTKQRLIEKQYNFLYQLLTGKKVYFGERPKTAHHWMVISEALFDRREVMMANCLRKHGLPEPLIQRLRALEERYRKVIVKSRPWPKIVFGEEMPLDGYDELELTVGSLCDSCQADIPKGQVVRYHVRLGTIFCPKCMANQAAA